MNITILSCDGFSFPLLQRSFQKRAHAVGLETEIIACPVIMDSLYPNNRCSQIRLTIQLQWLDFESDTNLS